MTMSMIQAYANFYQMRSRSKQTFKTLFQDWHGCSQGPPGTGKTRTLVALMQVILQANSSVTRKMQLFGPILACADTNAATDNLVDGLQQCGVRVVRVGAPAKVCCTTRCSATLACAWLVL